MLIVHQDQCLIASSCLEQVLCGDRTNPIHSALCDILDGAFNPYVVVGAKTKNGYIGCAVYNKRTKVMLVHVKDNYGHSDCSVRLVNGIQSYIETLNKPKSNTVIFSPNRFKYV